jgi:hypothetical protein
VAKLLKAFKSSCHNHFANHGFYPLVVFSSVGAIVFNPAGVAYVVWIVSFLQTFDERINQ